MGRKKWGLQCPYPGCQPSVLVQDKGTWRCDGGKSSGLDPENCYYGLQLWRSPKLLSPCLLLPGPGPTLTPFRGSPKRGLFLAHPDGVGQPWSKDPSWRRECQVARPLLTRLLSLPPAQLLPWKLAHPICSRHYLPRAHWSCRVRGQIVWESSVWACDPWGGVGCGH